MLGMRIGGNFLTNEHRDGLFRHPLNVQQGFGLLNKGAFYSCRYTVLASVGRIPDSGSPPPRVSRLLPR
jgi:hypothetical protein